MRRLSRFTRHRTLKFNSSSNISKDYITIAYYLYNILKDEIDVTTPSIELICRLIQAGNLYDKAKIVLDKFITDLTKNKQLISIQPLEPTQVPHFSQLKLPCEYTIDQKIDNCFSFEGIYKDIQLDLYRAMIASPTPIISRIIANIFFTENEENIKNPLKFNRDNQVISPTPNKSQILPSKLRRQIFSTKKVKFLKDEVELSESEALYILTRYNFAFIKEINFLYNDLDLDDTKLFSSILNISQTNFRKLIRPDQKLQSYGFINDQGDITGELVDCIIEQSLEPYFADCLKPLDCSQAYNQTSFSVPETTTNVMINLLKNQDSTSLLLYGKPGSGKTEYAKMLGKNTGYKTFIYKNENDILTGAKAVAHLNCYLSIKQKDTIIIVDEADKLLQTVSYTPFGIIPTSTKGTINKMLEENKNKIIWIINHQNQLDESTRRRFTMSYQFSEMPLTMLQSITKSKFATLNLSQPLEEKLISLLTKYAVTGASVENIVKTISSLQNQDEDTLIKSVTTVLEENAKLLDGNTNRIRENVGKAYNPNVINTSIEPDKIVCMVENAIKFSQENKNCENGIRMLFYGASGTGKTELVRYLAQKLNKKILLRRASDILGPYVGETEGAIKTAFQQAATEDQILLFDEADSFFSDREKAERSWERTMTNEFLTQMEEFPGILICTTNLKDIMDPAMSRRFQIMVEFKPMEKTGIKTLLETYFTAYNFTELQINHLASKTTITPGDFGSLSSRLRFMNPKDLTSDYIVNELYKLQEEKSPVHNSIGF